MNDTKNGVGMHLVTSEQGVLEAETIFQELMNYGETTRATLDEVEGHIFRMALRLGRAVMQRSVEARAEAESVAAIEMETGQSVPYRGQRTFRLVTIFGGIEVERAYFWSGETGGVTPMDEEMSRPRRCYSSLLEEWALRMSVMGPFEASVDWLAERLGVRMPKRMVEVMSVEAAVDVKTFYETRGSVPVATPDDCVVVSLDGKGIPMTKTELAVTPARSKRGEKAQKKKMATVATVFTVKREDRLASVGGGRGLPDIALADKRMFAELTDKPALTPFVAARLAERRGVEVPTAFLADGQPALWGLKAEICPDAVEILDFHHAREYLWKAVHTFLPEGSPEATDWVKLQESRFLSGHVALVIGGLRRRLTTGVVGDPAKRQTVEKVIHYFDANRARMRYDRYLKAGFPIGSGAVESACKQLIVTRMEGAGMRWTVQGAQAMLDLRSVFLNGDWTRYWSFHRAQEHRRLYGSPAKSAELSKPSRIAA